MHVYILSTNFPPPHSECTCRNLQMLILIPLFNQWYHHLPYTQSNKMVCMGIIKGGPCMMLVFFFLTYFTVYETLDSSTSLKLTQVCSFFYG